MAGSQVSESVALTILQAQRLGYIALTLDEWTTTNEPEITAGSKIEIGGSIYTFAALEDIDPDGDWGGFANSTQVYCKLIVSGTSVTSKLTTTAPTWDDAKQGYYGTGGSALHRYYGFIYKDASGNYARKGVYLGRELVQTNYGNVHGDNDLSLVFDDNADANIEFARDADILWDESEDEFYFNKPILVDTQIETAGLLKGDSGIQTDGIALKTKEVNIGTWNMDSTASVSVAHGLTLTDIRSISILIRRDDGNRIYELPYLSTDGSFYITGANVVMARSVGGVFDSTDFDGASNRGWITITYEA